MDCKTNDYKVSKVRLYTTNIFTIDLNKDKIPELIYTLALGLVGGYGGRSIIDRALSTIAKGAAKDAKEAKKEVEEAKKSVQEAKDKMTQIQEFDTMALELVHTHLDEDEEIQDIQVLKDAIKVSSRATRYTIFKEASALRQANWRNNKPLMERTIPIFEALIDNNEGEQFHRNHAQLGYALKDKREPKEWERAYQELTKAIDIRDKNGVKGFLMYEFNRAQCSIHLGKGFDSIESDIKKGAQRPSLLIKLKEDDFIKDWAKQNQYDLETLKKKTKEGPSAKD